MLNPCNKTDKIAIAFLKDKKNFTDHEIELYIEKVSFLAESGEDDEKTMYRKAYQSVLKEREYELSSK